MLQDSIKYPIVVQLSDVPIFRGLVQNDQKFICGKCKNILIENYIIGDYIGLQIECFRCKEITETPYIGHGEPLSSTIISLGSKGRLGISSTVLINPHIIVGTDQSIEIAFHALQPRDPDPLCLSLSNLEYLVKLYDVITDGKFLVQSSKLKRTKNSDPLEFPFAWAIEYFFNCYKGN